jgi:hypothetical protein
MGQLRNLFYNYWHILIGDRTKNYYPEMPGWRVLGCTYRGGHFRRGPQINVWKLQIIGDNTTIMHTIC